MIRRGEGAESGYLSAQALALPTLAFEIQTVRRIAKGPPLFYVLVADHLTVLDDVDDHHAMATAQPIILLKPVPE